MTTKKLIGFSVSGRIIANMHIKTLRTYTDFVHDYGHGVIVPVGTFGERSILKRAHEINGYSVGLFSDRIGWQNFRHTVTKEVNTYNKQKQEWAKQMYEACGKSWDFLMPTQQRDMVVCIDLAYWSSILLIWPETIKTNMTEMAGAFFQRRMITLPQDETEALTAISQLM